MNIQNILKATLLVAMTLVMASGCTTSYPTEVYTVTKPTSSIDPTNTESSKNKLGSEELTVYINSHEFFSFSSGMTRGSGPFDNTVDIDKYVQKLKDSKFYIYAFRVGAPSNQLDAPAELKDSCDYRRYFKATTHISSGSSDPNNYHCLVDGIDYYEGLPMWVENKNNQLSGVDVVSEEGYKLEYDHSAVGDLRFNAKYPDLGYDFFCYYFDDINLSQMTPRREKDRIYYKDFTIDGTEDVLCGASPKVSDNTLNRLSLSSADRKRILNANGYTSFGASCGLFPQIPLTHQLARLKFFAVAGKKSAEGMKILSIAVHSKYKGEFTVATRNPQNHPQGIAWSNEKTKLVLKEASETGTSPCQPLKQDDSYVIRWQDEWNDVDWVNRATEDLGALRIGGSLLVAPDVEYTIELEYLMPETSEVHKAIQSLEMINPTDGNYMPFEAGKEYPVYIGVFGPEDVWVGVDITKWQPADPVFIDPDDPSTESHLN